jgi:hypothetical protein
MLITITPVPADLTTIPMGGDVFIGEQGLKIPVPAGTVLSYYTGTLVPGVNAPTATVTVTDPNNFYVAPAQFVKKTGYWYIGNSSTVALDVNDPAIIINAWDQQSQKIISGKSVPDGDYLNFRIETNLARISSQRNDTTGFVNIRVKSSDGTIYPVLLQDKTTAIPLAGQSVNAMPFFWINKTSGSYGWSTGILDAQGHRIYSAGVYTFWAELDLNGMIENYKDPAGCNFTGKTVSLVEVVTIPPKDIVKIETSKDSVVQGQPFQATIYGVPGWYYDIWIAGTGSMSGRAGDQPPWIVPGYDVVRQDPIEGPFYIGDYSFHDGNGRTIRNDVPQGFGNQDVNGTVYYAQVLLSNSGTRTVQFLTSRETKDKTYTIHVERTSSFSNATYPSNDATITVQKGAVTIVAAGDQQYFLGEQIELTGTNSATRSTYLFITGPNLPTTGGRITDPRTPVIPGDPTTFSPQDILEDNTWSYKWQTSNLNLDAGTYTVYAVSTPDDKANVINTEYGNVSIILRKPFVNAAISQPFITIGDTLYINGTAHGGPIPGVAIWIIGDENVIFHTEHVDEEGRFSYNVNNSISSELGEGRYFVIVQHPMYNDRFDVYPDSPLTPVSILGSYPVSGTKLFTMGGAGSLHGNAAAEALIQAISDPNVDDTYTALSFLVEHGRINITPIGSHRVGDKFTISGGTNLQPGDQITIQVNSSSSRPISGQMGIIGVVDVFAGSGGLNTWSFPIDTSSFTPDEYLVQARGLTVTGVQAITLFNLTADIPPITAPITIPTTTSIGGGWRTNLIPTQVTTKPTVTIPTTQVPSGTMTVPLTMTPTPIPTKPSLWDIPFPKIPLWSGSLPKISFGWIPF